MTLKQKHILIDAGCYLLILALMPLFDYWCDKYDNLWLLAAFALIVIGLLMVPAIVSKYKTEKAVLKPGFVPSEQPEVTVGNHLTRKDYLRSALLFLLFYAGLDVITYIVIGTANGIIAVSVLCAIVYVWTLRSAARSTYTLRADRLIVKEYRLGRQTADLDIPIGQIENMRYQYNLALDMNQWLLMEVNGNKLELHPMGCTEQLAQEIIARQKRLCASGHSE